MWMVRCVCVICSSFYKGRAGSWESKILYLFLIVTRWRENLSSGENRAGWADFVAFPKGSTFYKALIQRGWVKKKSSSSRVSYLKGVHTFTFLVQIVHQIHGRFLLLRKREERKKKRRRFFPLKRSIWDFADFKVTAFQISHWTLSLPFISVLHEFYLHKSVSMVCWGFHNRSVSLFLVTGMPRVRSRPVRI